MWKSKFRATKSVTERMFLVGGPATWVKPLVFRSDELSYQVQYFPQGCRAGLCGHHQNTRKLGALVWWFPPSSVQTAPPRDHKPTGRMATSFWRVCRGVKSSGNACHLFVGILLNNVFVWMVSFCKLFWFNRWTFASGIIILIWVTPNWIHLKKIIIVLIF